MNWNADAWIELSSRFQGVDLLSKRTRGRYYTGNQWFDALDATVLVNILHMYKPETIIEVGCGFSSLLISETWPTAYHICIDPEPRTDISGLDCWSTKVEEIDLNVFANWLVENDVLFIDSSHVCSPGSDVDFLIHKVLPVLEHGVLVHFHDIFLPDDYPPSWQRRGYNEAQVLAQFLDSTNLYEVLWPQCFMARRHGQVFDRFGVPIIGASFWLRRK
jgi:hypothetical protein